MLILKSNVSFRSIQSLVTLLLHSFNLFENDSGLFLEIMFSPAAVTYNPRSPTKGLIRHDST